MSDSNEQSREQDGDSEEQRAEQATPCTSHTALVELLELQGWAKHVPALRLHDANKPLGEQTDIGWLNRNIFSVRKRRLDELIEEVRQIVDREETMIRKSIRLAERERIHRLADRLRFKGVIKEKP